MKTLPENTKKTMLQNKIEVFATIEIMQYYIQSTREMTQTITQYQHKILCYEIKNLINKFHTQSAKFS